MYQFKLCQEKTAAQCQALPGTENSLVPIRFLFFESPGLTFRALHVRARMQAQQVLLLEPRNDGARARALHRWQGRITAKSGEPPTHL